MKIDLNVNQLYRWDMALGDIFTECNSELKKMNISFSKFHQIKL